MVKTRHTLSAGVFLAGPQVDRHTRGSVYFSLFSRVVIEQLLRPYNVVCAQSLLHMLGTLELYRLELVARCLLPLDFPDNHG